MPVSKKSPRSTKKPSQKNSARNLAAERSDSTKLAKPSTMNLSLAASRSDWDSALALLARGAPPDRCFPPYLDGPLWLACQRKDFRMAKLLLGAGASPDKRSFQGETPLCLAARLGALELAVALCAAGADPLAKRLPDQKTPVDIAREAGDMPMAELLSAALARMHAPSSTRLNVDVA